ncbi:MAG: hypothetical protein JWM59_5099 [Verrucomicrobiales bacterium]|nr:hypothetical protein [Verrucomicrobiales bacterium]
MTDSTKPRRKLRDSLEDAISAPVYTGDPLPPYISIIKDLIYISYRVDKEAAQALLPEGMTCAEGATIALVLLYIGAGWGIADACMGFFAITVEEFSPPDTSEAAFFVAPVMSDPSCRLASEHYGPFQSGGVEISVDNDDIIVARMWSKQGGEIVRATMRANGPLQPSAANDRYIGRAAGGTVTSCPNITTFVAMLYVLSPRFCQSRRWHYAACHSLPKLFHGRRIRHRSVMRQREMSVTLSLAQLRCQGSRQPLSPTLLQARW